MKKSVKRKKRVVLSKAELENIRWFSKLSLTNKLVAIEEQIKTIHYLRSLVPWNTKKNPNSNK
jgi:hypothetical protein